MSSFLTVYQSIYNGTCDEYYYHYHGSYDSVESYEDNSSSSYYSLENYKHTKVHYHYNNDKDHYNSDQDPQYNDKITHNDGDHRNSKHNNNDYNDKETPINHY